MVHAARVLNSAPVRKGRALANRVPQAAVRRSARPFDYRKAPPVVVNSLPKSGTHMLMQIAQGLPGTRYFGTFIPQTPSLTLRERRQDALDRLIQRIAPGEVVGAHLYYNERTAAALDTVNALHLFIHRDPRDVLLSEVHYLTSMAPWHRMHRAFASLDDHEARVHLAIVGDGTDRYPDSSRRIGAYLGWCESENPTVVSYEQLSDRSLLLSKVGDIIKAYGERGASITDSAGLRQSLIDAIEPEKSHTFNRGTTGRWRHEMSEQAVSMCVERFPWLET